MKVLVLAYIWPEPESSAAGWRMLDLIRALRGYPAEVHVASHAAWNEPADRLKREGCAVHSIQLNDSSFDSWIRELSPDVVVFDRFISEEQWGARVSNEVPDALRILDTSDLHSLRRSREEGVEGVSSDTLRELASIHRCDLTWVVSDFEKKFLMGRYGVLPHLVEVSRFFVDEVPSPESLPSWEERDGFTTIGNFRHPPNADAVVYLRREIWPLIRQKMPHAEIRIYGSYPTPAVMKMHAPEIGFCIEGPVPDARAALAQAKVSLVALRFGAGIKGKVIDSWMAGTPVVATPIAAEGMTEGNAFPGQVELDPARFAEAAVELYHSAEQAAALQRSGFEMLQKYYLKNEGYRQIVSHVRIALEEKSTRRELNWIGMMLAREQYRSTLYFSRWIELKEKKQL